MARLVDGHHVLGKGLASLANLNHSFRAAHNQLFISSSIEFTFSTVYSMYSAILKVAKELEGELSRICKTLFTHLLQDCVIFLKAQTCIS